MKTKLTPGIAYLIGLWKTRKTNQGIGVRGNDKTLAVFTEEIIKNKLSAHNKILTDKNCVYFYHSAYRILFQNVLKERMERFKIKNAYSGNYLAGIFDGAGGYAQNPKSIYIMNADKKDEMLALRFGFKAVLMGKRLMIEKADFMNFINRYRKLLIPGEELTNDNNELINEETMNKNDDIAAQLKQIKEECLEIELQRELRHKEYLEKKKNKFSKENNYNQTSNNYNKDKKPEYKKEYNKDYDKDKKTDYNKDKKTDYNKDKKTDYDKDKTTDYNKDKTTDYNKDKKTDYNKDKKTEYNKDKKTDNEKEYKKKYDKK